MSAGRRTTLLAYLTHLGRAAAAENDDAVLLERFADRRDEEAFAALLRRHGPLVWGVCRRVLAEEHAAEDAFQATFLALVRKARSVSKRASIRSWLYGVALRVAVRARRQAGLRRVREQSSPPRQATEAAWPDVRSILDEEIQRLPEKYRLPVILCYLEGRTNDEAARRLNCPRGTIATRLARAREKLRSRLVRRGLTLSAGGLGVMLSEDVVSAVVPPALVPHTLQCALGGSGSVAINSLTEGVIKAMFVTKLTTSLVVVLALSMIGGAGAWTYYLHAQAPGDEEPTKFPEKQRPEKIAPAKPEAALRKLLTQRRDMAEQEAKIRYEQYNAGAQGATFELVIESSKRLLKADLELSTDRLDRIAAHERHLKLVKEYADVVEARFMAGRVGLEVHSQAQYERLDAEIQLEREKARK
jgi:RNA polymerase sigma factor (sigma-70 family)